MALHCMHYSITAYLSEPLIKDSHKRLSSTVKPQYRVLQVMWSHITITYVLCGNIAREEKVDLVAVSLNASKFWTKQF